MEGVGEFLTGFPTNWLGEMGPATCPRLHLWAQKMCAAKLADQL